VKIKCPAGDAHSIDASRTCPHCLHEIPKPVLHALLAGRDRERTKKEKPAYGVGTLVSECLRQSYYKLTEEQILELDKLWIFSRGTAMHNFVTHTLVDKEKEIFVRKEFPAFDVIGFIDAVHDSTIYEFKTTSNIPEEPQHHHVMQAQGYFSMLSEEEQKNIAKILIVYLSMMKIKTFEIPKRNITAYLESRAAILTNALNKKIPPAKEISWLCKYCEFNDTCFNRDKAHD
jgi:CRISPR/Cas system-associated exonuclease Cas4 (RecB family)